MPFFILVITQLTLNAQKKYLQCDFRTSLEINQLRTLGGSFSLHPKFGKYFSLGAGVDLIRVKDIPKNVVPVYLDASFKFPIKEFETFLFLQGGINGYDENSSNFGNNTRKSLTGKSFLGAGTGFYAGKPDAKLRLFWAFKYRVYRFSETLIYGNGTSELLSRPEKDQYSFSIGVVY